MLRKLFFAFFIVLAAQAAFAGDQVAELSEIEYLEDPERSLSFEEVSGGAADGRWKRLEGTQANFGVSASRFWLRATARVPEKRGGEWYLVVANPFLEKITLRVAGAGEPVIGGVSVPLSQRKLRIADNVLPVELKEGSSKLYLSVESSMALVLPVSLLSPDAFSQRYSDEHLVLGFFLGFLVFCAICSIGLCVSSPSKELRSYTYFLLSMILFYLTLGGLAQRLLWPEATWWALRTIHVLGAIAFLCHMQFMRLFAGSKTHVPRLDLVLKVLIVVSTLRGLWVLIAGMTPAVGATGAFVILAGNIVAMLVGAFSWSKSRNARFLTVASLAFNISVVFYMLQYTGVMFIASNIEFISYAGTAIEVAIFGIGIFDWLQRLLESARQQRLAVVRAEKLSALGEMAAGISHEINNPLTVIQASAELIIRYSESGKASPEVIRECATEIVSTSQRIARIIKAVSAYVRKGEHAPMVPTPLSRIIDDSLTLCRERFRTNGVELTASLPAESALVQARAGECTQVLVNLLNNAFDAVSAAQVKRVTLEVADRDICYEISVTDSGTGIPELARDRLFEPFFTTKAAANGTGLGLSISKTIVESHGGFIRAEAAPQGSGTRFVFSLLKPVALRD